MHPHYCSVKGLVFIIKKTIFVHKVINQWHSKSKILLLWQLSLSWCINGILKDFALRKAIKKLPPVLTEGLWLVKARYIDTCCP